MLRARCSQLQAEVGALSRELDTARRQPEQQWRASLAVSAELTAVRQEAAEVQTRNAALEQAVQAVQAVSTVLSGAMGWVCRAGGTSRAHWRWLERVH